MVKYIIEGILPMKFLSFFLLSWFFVFSVFAQTQTNTERLKQLSELFHQRYVVEKAKAIEIANQNGWPIKKIGENGTIMEIQYINHNGIPIYYSTDNLNAAKTVSTNQVWTGGRAGLNLTGIGVPIGEWDGGAIRGSHQELTGRIHQIDSPSSNSDHSTHVAGTMIASGIDASAHGMATSAEINAYDYNDDNAEMAAAADGLRLSNHSYGIICGWDSFGLSWYGDPNISNDEDYKFGFYSENESRAWDEIAFNAPYYLIVKSAGNDRGQGPLLGNSHPADYEPDDGYDTIGPQGVAKNILTVGAIKDIPNGYSQPSDVVMSSFSSWGPTDDGRIKPDIVANGVGLYSSTASSDNSYATYDGTSMSAPNATGSLALLQEHYANLHNGQWMLASTLKALVIHTADEAGDADGPDYRFGWGLLNTEKAANLISEDNNGALLSTIWVDTLQEFQTISYNIHSDGSSPLKLTLCWTDPPGTPVAPQLDPPDLMLVNDLDMRLIGVDSTYMPWVLDPNNRTAAATTGDNFRDNVEQIYLSAPPAGDYTVQISHKDTLYNHQQVFSLIINDAQFNGSPNSLQKVTHITPNKFYLYSNFPNPFNPSTSIRFDLAQSGRTSLTIYNVLGKKIATLVDAHLSAGQYTFKWDAKGQASGIYFYRLQSGKFSKVRRMLLTR